MSSRRGAGEENILAMLERDSARRLGPRMSGVRLASYGAAAALAGILAGGIAWLAYDNHKSAQELQTAHDTADVGVPVAIPDAAAPPQAPPAIAAAHPVDAPRTALIVDESPPKREVAVASAVPPLVMLPPHEVNGTKPPPAPPAQDSVQARPAKPEPVRTVARVEKKAEKTVKVASNPTKAAKPSKPAQARSTAPAKAKTGNSARARKPAAAADAPVDSDVALISAIIQHSERHRGESSCSGSRCPSKPARP
ncbi:hypothetical protein [Massilia suwonensis]|uniref:Uncharacterized protein n=1 Tax=Massilia suwonensis TaxID=648895 RepID=A0ABW0MRZ7_9BURK